MKSTEALQNRPFLAKSGWGNTVRTYYSLTKPGVLYGNVLTGLAGFLLAARWHINIGLLLATITGMSLVIGAACALNNYLDRDIDSRMERTRQRATVTGAVGRRGAVLFAAALGISGIVILALFVNWLVVVIGVAGFIDYVWLYAALSKRRSIHGTLVGSISGAAPIFAGYCAVRGHIDAGAILVFLILFFWQMPEFYSISIYRRKEYAAAKVPVMSVIKGVKNTKIQIFIYTVLYVIATLLLTPFGYTGWVYFAVMLLLGLYWIYLGALGLRRKEGQPSEAWARKMFRFSLITILALSVMLSIGPVLP